MGLYDGGNSQNNGWDYDNNGNGRWFDQIPTMTKLEDAKGDPSANWKALRPVASPFIQARHWMVSAKGTKFPVICPDFDPATRAYRRNGCPIHAHGEDIEVPMGKDPVIIRAKASMNMLLTAIDREMQENEPDGDWIRVFQVGDLRGKFKKMLGRRGINPNDAHHPNNGFDIDAQFDMKATPAEMYSVEFRGPSKLTKAEIRKATGVYRVVVTRKMLTRMTKFDPKVEARLKKFGFKKKGSEYRAQGISGLGLDQLCKVETAVHVKEDGRKYREIHYILAGVEIQPEERMPPAIPDFAVLYYPDEPKEILRALKMCGAPGFADEEDDEEDEEQPRRKKKSKKRKFEDDDFEDDEEEDDDEDDDLFGSDDEDDEDDDLFSDDEEEEDEEDEPEPPKRKKKSKGKGKSKSKSKKSSDKPTKKSKGKGKGKAKSKSLGKVDSLLKGLKGKNKKKKRR